jgi:HSP20 family protein
MAQDLIHLMRSLFLPAAERFPEGPWRPLVDVYRTRTGWLLKFDLAGVRREDLCVSAQGRCLTVRGCRRDWFAEERQDYYLMEIAYSKFERSVELPCDLACAEVATDYRDGMLLVRVKMEVPS